MGTSLISGKGENLRKGQVDLEKGGMNPLTNYDSSSIHRYFFDLEIKYFLDL